MVRLFATGNNRPATRARVSGFLHIMKRGVRIENNENCNRVFRGCYSLSSRSHTMVIHSLCGRHITEHIDSLIGLVAGSVGIFFRSFRRATNYTDLNPLIRFDSRDHFRTPRFNWIKISGS